MFRFLLLLLSLSILAAVAPERVSACGNGDLKKETASKQTDSCCTAKKGDANSCCGDTSHEEKGHCGHHCCCAAHASGFLTTGETTLILFNPRFEKMAFTYLAPYTAGIRSGVWLPPNLLA